MYDDTFMNELEKILTCFKAISHCFGFDVPEYNCMFMQYDKNIMALVSERMKAVRVFLTTREEHDAASDAAEDLLF